MCCPSAPKVTRTWLKPSRSGERAQARASQSCRRSSTLGAGSWFRLQGLIFLGFGSNEAAHGTIDELGLGYELAREPAVAVVEQGDMLLEPSKFPLLRLDADFQRVTLGNQA